MFDQIKNMIQKMIFHLMDEQKNEDEHKHWYDGETETSCRMREDFASCVFYFKLSRDTAD